MTNEKHVPTHNVFNWLKFFAIFSSSTQERNFLKTVFFTKIITSNDATGERTKYASGTMSLFCSHKEISKERKGFLFSYFFYSSHLLGQMFCHP